MNPQLAAIYIRVSSEMQLEGHSLDAQERICREWCARNGLAVDEAHVYREEAESASTNERPEFLRLMAAARAKAFVAIVFYHTWRFSRNIEDAGLMSRLERTGVRLCSATESIDSSTPAGRLQRHITLAIGQHYLDQLRAETTRGKQERARQGKSNASRPPYGYSRTATREDVPNQEADTAREIFERFSTAQYSFLQIAEWLNSQGKTTDGNWGKRPFSKDTVRAILVNPFYAGWVGYRGMSSEETESGKRKRNSKKDWQWVRGTHEPIISQELFDKCQDVRAKRGKHYAGRRPARSRVYLLSRLACCSHCGRPLRATRWYADGNAYRCTSRERGYECGADRSHTPEDALTQDLDDIIARLHLTDRVKASALALIESGDMSAAIDRQRAKLDGEMTRLNRMYQLGNIADDYYETETLRIRGELAGLAKPSSAVDIRAATAMIESMAALWQQATTEERAGILRALFDAIAIDVDARRVSAFKPKNEYAALFRAAFAIYGSDGRRTPRNGLKTAFTLWPESHFVSRYWQSAWCFSPARAAIIQGWAHYVAC